MPDGITPQETLPGGSLTVWGGYNDHINRWRTQMKFVNLTPHTITIYDLYADKITLPSEGVARVETTEREMENVDNIPIVSAPIPGPVTGLPEPSAGVSYIVSLMVLQHPSLNGRQDVYAPATGPNHAAMRDGEGRIIGVTRLIAAPSKD
jgi:hypothetical protein